MTKQGFKANARRILEPVVVALDSLGVPPFLISFFGLAFSLYGALVVADGSLFLGAIFLVLSGVCDVLDGDLARRRNMVSRFGAFIDSTFDRVTEFAYFGGILFLAVNRVAGFHNWQIVVTFIALAGSVLTSYARARAEGLDVECRVGVMERPERVALLVVGLLLGFRVLMVVMTILAITSVYTFIQRVRHVHRMTRAHADASVPPAGSNPDEPTEGG